MKQLKIYVLALFVCLCLPFTAFTADNLLMLPLKTEGNLSQSNKSVVLEQVKSILSKSYTLLKINNLEKNTEVKTLLETDLYNNKAFADLGKKLKADKVLNGSLTYKNGVYRIELRLISVSSKNLLVLSFRESKKEADLALNAKAAALPLLHYAEIKGDSFNTHSASVYMGSGRIVSLSYDFNYFNFSLSPSFGLNVYEIDDEYFYGLAAGIKLAYNLQKINDFLRPYFFTVYSHHFKLKNYTERDSMNFGLGVYVFDQFYFESSFMFLFKHIENTAGEATKNSFVIGFGYRYSF